MRIRGRTSCESRRSGGDGLPAANQRDPDQKPTKCQDADVVTPLVRSRAIQRVFVVQS